MTRSVSEIHCILESRLQCKFTPLHAHGHAHRKEAAQATPLPGHSFIPGVLTHLPPPLLPQPPSPPGCRDPHQLQLEQTPRSQPRKAAPPPSHQERGEDPSPQATDPTWRQRKDKKPRTRTGYLSRRLQRALDLTVPSSRSLLSLPLPLQALALPGSLLTWNHPDQKREGSEVQGATGLDGHHQARPSGPPVRPFLSIPGWRPL